MKKVKATINLMNPASLEFSASRTVKINPKRFRSESESPFNYSRISVIPYFDPLKLV